ncbi:MAG: thiamine kinase-like enzyme [Rubritalea sp.]|jgi:thiamine kinase-like enzyme
MSHPIEKTQEMIKAISHEFAIAGEFLEGLEIDSGHINSTYLVVYEEPNGKQAKYILQRINEYVFKDPLMVMKNVEVVTRHINWKVLRVKKDLGGQTLNIYPARGGRSFAYGKNGGVWRCYNYIENCHTYDVVENSRQAYQAAKAFGSFQDLVSDLPVEEVAETIPDFHNTPKRYARLMEVIAADPKGRLKNVAVEVSFIKQREELCKHLVELAEQGKLPVRVTHNDTKLNNVMMDSETDEAVCVIDLDTVMPGLSLYDFGDLVRTATSPAEEDEKDLSKVEMRMSMFEALAEGYIDGCDCLTPLEIENLVIGGKLMTLEVGIRFLTDYLEGDQYFKTEYDDHNLVRSRTQLKLVECIEQKEEEMNKFVSRVAKSKY